MGYISHFWTNPKKSQRLLLIQLLIPSNSTFFQCVETLIPVRNIQRLETVMVFQLLQSFDSAGVGHDIPMVEDAWEHIPRKLTCNAQKTCHFPYEKSGVGDALTIPKTPCFLGIWLGYPKAGASSFCSWYTPKSYSWSYIPPLHPHKMDDQRLLAPSNGSSSSAVGTAEPRSFALRRRRKCRCLGTTGRHMGWDGGRMGRMWDEIQKKTSSEP
jgi:hypothetical protein